MEKINIVLGGLIGGVFMYIIAVFWFHAKPQKPKHPQVVKPLEREKGQGYNQGTSRQPARSSADPGYERALEQQRKRQNQRGAKGDSRGTSESRDGRDGRGRQDRQDRQDSREDQRPHLVALSSYRGGKR